MKKSLLTLLAVAAMSTTALAADVKPALVYGTGGKFDKSFNEAAFNGAEKFKKETGIAYRDFEPTGDTPGFARCRPCPASSVCRGTRNAHAGRRTQ